MTPAMLDGYQELSETCSDPIKLARGIKACVEAVRQRDEQIAKLRDALKVFADNDLQFIEQAHCDIAAEVFAATAPEGERDG
jgi:hypothetical protein